MRSLWGVRAAIRTKNSPLPLILLPVCSLYQSRLIIRLWLHAGKQQRKAEHNGGHVISESIDYHLMDDGLALYWLV